MGESITFPSHRVAAHGINPSAVPDPQKLQKYFFREEFQALKRLRELPVFPRAECTLLYPGCGVDILTPLLYLNSLFPQLHQATFIFVDKDLPLTTIKAILDDVGISFAEHQNSFSFFWNSVLIKVEGITGDIFQLLPALPSYDLYFEKAFRIMKESDPGYEEKVFARLRPGGLIISDSGFQAVPVERFPIPAELSAYGEMIFGQKTS